MDNNKKKKIAILLMILGVIIMVGIFVYMFITLFSSEESDLTTILISTMVGFCVGFGLLLTGVGISSRVKYAKINASTNNNLLEKKDSNISSEPVQKTEQTTTNNISTVSKTYPVESADKTTILNTWATICLLIVSLITAILLFSKGFDWWMLVLIALIIFGFALIVIDFKKFKTSQTQVDKWNDKGKEYPQQANNSYIEMTLEKANKGFKNKFFFWASKNKACITKAVTSLISCVVVMIIILASIFTGFGAVINPVGEYIFDYSYKSGHGANSYEILILNEDNTYVDINYELGNKSKSETGIWEKSGSSLYVYAQKRYNEHGELIWSLSPNETYPEQTNYEIALGEITSSSVVMIKR